MGVLGGFGEYFNVDPVILRVLFAGISIFTAIIPGIFAYFIAALLMPNSPEARAEASSSHEHEAEHRREQSAH